MMEAVRLGIPFANWTKKMPIKVQGRSQSGVRSPAHLSRQGWERLLVYHKKHD